MATSIDCALNAFFSGSFQKKFKKNGKTPTVSLGNGKTVSGVTCVAKHLQRTSKEHSDGLSLEQRMQVEQWIDYAATSVKFSNSESEKSVLKSLNNHLKDKVYFAAGQLTLADIIMYYYTFSLVSKLSYHEKEQFIHLSRWFHHIQQNDSVRQSLQKLPFLRTLVYDGIRLH